MKLVCKSFEKGTGEAAREWASLSFPALLRAERAQGGSVQAVRFSLWNSERQKNWPSQGREALRSIWSATAMRDGDQQGREP